MMERRIDVSSLNPETFIVTKLFVFNPVFKAWSFEPYINCSYRCVYCSSDAQGKSKPAVNVAEYADTLNHEMDLVEASIRQWKIKAPIMISLITDAYVPAEKEYRYTRRLLQELVKRQLPYNIITKGLLVESDMDVLKETSTDYRVFVSFGSTDGKNQKHIEPYVPDIDERIALINRMHNAGIPVTLNIAPWIPGITDVEAIIKRVSADTPVSVCALEYHELLNERYFIDIDALKNLHILNEGLLGGWLKKIFNDGLSNSTKAVYGRLWSQKEINELYVAERIHVGYRPNIFWAEPPHWKGSHTATHCIKPLDVGDSQKHS